VDLDLDVDADVVAVVLLDDLRLCVQEHDSDYVSV